MLKQLLFCILGISFSIMANADETYRMNADYFVRSSPNFLGERNVVGVLGKGSSFKVINRKKFSNGAEALQVHILSLSPTSKVSPSDDYWIYKPNNRDFTKTDKSTTEAQGGSAACPECLKASEIDQVSRNNRDNIGNVSRQIIGQQNQPAPTPEPTKTTADVKADEMLKKYSSSNKVKKMIDHALRNKKPQSQGTCYRSVKKALLASNLIPHYYSDLAALNSKNSLKQFGFVNLLENEPYKSNIGNNPNLAPKGAVLVYSSGIPCGGKNGVSDCGHVEIKTDEPGKAGFVSDFYSNYAINQTPAARKYGTNYKLVGVMIKPGD